MVASRTLLFVDDHDILYRPGTARRLRPLDRCPQNPVLPARGKPWEINIGWVGNAFDPVTGLYQLWYQAFTGPFAQKRTHRCLVCYAESTDGIHWTKPDLDLFDYNGILPTNIVMIGNGGYSDRYTNSVLLDLRDPDPARRYKMATYDFSMDEGIERPGLVVAFSPDGIHWTKHPKAPLLRTFYGDRLSVPYVDETGREWDLPLSISDAMDAIWDEPRGVYAIYSKMWIDGPDGRQALEARHGAHREPRLHPLVKAGTGAGPRRARSAVGGVSPLTRLLLQRLLLRASADPPQGSPGRDHGRRAGDQPRWAALAASLPRSPLLAARAGGARLTAAAS